MPLDDPKFAYFQEMVAQRSGVLLQERNRALVSERVSTLSMRFGFGGVEHFIEHLRESHYSRLHREVVEELIAEDTFFFRDFATFKVLRHNVFPEVLAARKMTSQLNVWCAGCASGQEAYSISIMAREAIPSLTGWEVRIVGTDISHSQLAQAQSGVYSEYEVRRGLPEVFLDRHFQKLDGTHWVIDPTHQDAVEFFALNLLEPARELPVFDIVFLRNVLRYFDESARQRVLVNIRARTHAGTYLLLGAGEPNPAPEQLAPCEWPDVYRWCERDLSTQPVEGAGADELAVFQAHEAIEVVGEVVETLPSETYLKLSFAQAPSIEEEEEE